MNRLSQITPGEDTNQWEVAKWAMAQGIHMPSPMHQCLLYYLSLNAFYEEDNPEDAHRGQVLYHASFVSEMSEGTGMRSRQSIRKCLNDLQDMGYIVRTERPLDGTKGQKPHLITVCWESDFDTYRQGLRSGEAKPIPALLVRPVCRSGVGKTITV